MLRDVEFFRSRLSKLDGSADIGDYVFNIVNNKAVKEAAPLVDTPAKMDEKAEKTAEKAPDGDGSNGKD